MPRKTRSSSRWRATWPPSFNEAAARCRGKRTGPARAIKPTMARFNEAAARCRGKRRPCSDRPAAAPASMRPRPDAAENPHLRGVDLDAGGASMRPRPDAAENGRRSCCAFRPGYRFNEAAARCRGKPPPGCGTPRPRRRASMRPRPDAAENAPHSVPRLRPLARFNEAAARCRGKHTLHGVQSMESGALQ